MICALVVSVFEYYFFFFSLIAFTFIYDEIDFPCVFWFHPPFSVAIIMHPAQVGPHKLVGGLLSSHAVVSGALGTAQTAMGGYSMCRG